MRALRARGSGPFTPQPSAYLPAVRRRQRNGIDYLVMEHLGGETLANRFCALAARRTPAEVPQGNHVGSSRARASTVLSFQATVQSLHPLITPIGRNRAT